jgi:hypothetical protein
VGDLGDGPSGFDQVQDLAATPGAGRMPSSLKRRKLGVSDLRDGNPRGGQV